MSRPPNVLPAKAAEAGHRTGARKPAAKSIKGLRAHLAGESGEACALRWYQAQGYTLLEQRWPGPHGEIDLILRRAEQVVFVEVKCSARRDAALAMISPRQMQRVLASAAVFLDGEPLGQLTETRIDVALVFGGGAVEIVENAFGQG